MTSAVTQSRIEKKYISDRPNFSLAVMKAHYSKDPEFSENYIFNIYFDTPSMSLLQDKLNGDLHKQKIRVRWYGDTPDLLIPNAAKLECKKRMNAGGIKKAVSITMPVKNVHSLLKSDAWSKILQQSLPKTSAWPPYLLWPMLLTRYRRRRFIDQATGTRLSFDDQICSLALSSSLINRGIGPTRLDEAVIEVKNTTGEMPRLLQLTDQLRITSFSKYANLLSKI